MANRFKIKNDTLTTQEFSEFLAFALKDQPENQRLKIKLDLCILGAYEFSKNPIIRLIQKIKFYVQRRQRVFRQLKAARKVRFDK